MPSNKRALATSDGMNIDLPYEISGTREIRSLPHRTKKSVSFYTYRSDTNLTSDDDSSGDEYDTDLGTALSDVEGDLDSFSRDNSVDMDDDEGQQVDFSIPAVPESWSDKGKGVDPREYGGDSKKRKLSDDVDCDADDEIEVSEVVTKRARTKSPPARLNLSRSNFGPTKSILEITEGMDCLGGYEITYQLDADDYDADIVSAELISAPPSPVTPRVPRQRTNGLNGRRDGSRAKRVSPMSALVNRVDRNKSARPVPYKVPVFAEAKIEQFANPLIAPVDRRQSCSLHIERLPGQATRAKLRRSSPTSLLPMRGHRQRLRRAQSERIQVGQVALAAMNEARQARIHRRKAMKAFHLHHDQAKTSAIAVRRSDQQVRNLDCKRLYRDQRRIQADRSRDASWCAMRLPPPQLPSSFAPIALLSPDSRATIQALMPAETDFGEEHRSTSPAVSEPPEYEPPPMPVVLPLRHHLRPRRDLRPTSNDAPQYHWFEEHFAGGQYTRRSPSPPPPFNAQTDRHVIIPVRFIDDDDEVDEGLAGLIPARELLPVSDHSEAQAPPAMIGAFPTPLISRPDLLPPAEIIAPVARRAYNLTRNPWEAALDLEEADDDMDAEIESADDEETVPEASVPVLSTLGRFLRFWR